jgi:molybdopterin-binding protein
MQVHSRVDTRYAKPALSPEEKSSGALQSLSAKGAYLMRYGARNHIVATVKTVNKGEVMSLVKYDITCPTEMASVTTTESVDALGLKVGDEVHLVVKAVHVLPVKE